MHSQKISAFGNANRNRGRSVLTVLSIAISVLLIVGLTAVSNYFNFASDIPRPNQLRLVTHHAASLAMPIPVSYAEQIRAIPGVKTVMPLQWAMGIIRPLQIPPIGGGGGDGGGGDKDVFQQYAVDPDPTEIMNEYNLAADTEQVAAYRNDPQGVMVGEGLMSSRGWKVGDTINVREQGFPFDANLTIRGTYGPGNWTTFMHYQYLTALMSKQVPEQADQALVLTSVVSSPADVPRVASAIDAIFRSGVRPTRTDSEQDFLANFSSNQGNVGFFCLLVGIAAGLGSLFILMNTMAISTEERTEEISRLRAGGLSGIGIVRLWMTESLLLALAGGALGVVIAAVMIRSADLGHITGGFVHNLGFGLNSVIIGFGAAVLVGLGGGLIPALKAASIASSARP